MILAFHILSALLSLLHLWYTYFRPTKLKLFVTYLLSGSTLASGVYLTINAGGQHMTEVCTAGILYMGIAVIGISASSRKLALITERAKQTR